MSYRSLYRLLRKLERSEEDQRIREQRRTPKRERPKCGARCRDGRPCQARPVWDQERDRPRNGKCRMHGGLSTGPRTEEGRKRAMEGARRGGTISAERRRAGETSGKQGRNGGPAVLRNTGKWEAPAAGNPHGSCRMREPSWKASAEGMGPGTSQSVPLDSLTAC